MQSRELQFSESLCTSQAPVFMSSFVLSLCPPLCTCYHSNRPTPEQRYKSACLTGLLTQSGEQEHSPACKLSCVESHTDVIALPDWSEPSSPPMLLFVMLHKIATKARDRRGPSEPSEPARLLLYAVSQSQAEWSCQSGRCWDFQASGRPGATDRDHVTFPSAAALQNYHCQSS